MWLGSFQYILGVVWLIQGRWVHSGAPRLLFGLFEVIGFTWECPGRRVFIQGRWVHSGAPWGRWVHLGRSVHSSAILGSLGSFWVVGFIRVRPRGSWVYYSVPLASLGTFVVVGFIRVHPGVVGFIAVRWVHLGVPCGSLGSFWCALVVVGLFGVVGFVQMRPGGHWVLYGSLGSFGCVVGVVGFILGLWVPLGAPRGLLGSFEVVRLIRVRPWSSFRVPWVSLGSFGWALGDIGFIRGR